MPTPKTSAPNCAAPPSSTTSSRRPGKVAIAATKQMVNQRDLALAYSPGVAAACEEIVADPANAFRYTSRGNLVAVVTNGTAVLGLGDIGPLAAKPVMEGKAVLFKKFAGIDVFDLEVAEKNLDKLVDIIAALEPTFGGINLEDIKAPDCFYVERKLRERMKIPVFHDDQHGTAIVVGAALLNALKVVGKDIGQVKLVVQRRRCRGAGLPGPAGQAGRAAREHLGHRPGRCGLRRPHRTDGRGQGVFAQKTAQAHAGRGDRRRRRLPGPVGRRACSSPMVAKMAREPIIFALANPTPGDPARGGEGGARRRHHRHRPHRLPEPGQQRPVFPVHLPRCARLRRHDGDRRDGDRRRARHRRAGAGRAERGGGGGLCRRDAELRPRVPDPQALRPAADDEDRAGRGPGGGRIRRGAAARSRTWTPTARSCRASSTPRARR
jgi:hypothetical protein